MATKWIACVLTVTFLLSSASGKDWRGIVPLHSARADVQALLGPDDGDNWTVYHLKEGTVYVWYSSEKCGSSEAVKWNVPSGTVLEIWVHARKPVPLRTLNLDLSTFDRFRGDSDVGGHFWLINVVDGFGLSVQDGGAMKGEIADIYLYGARADDANLRCPSQGIGRNF